MNQLSTEQVLTTDSDPSETGVRFPTNATERLVVALKDPTSIFTSAQVAFLMATATRWGYEARVDEENACYPPGPIYLAGALITAADQHAARKQAYEAPSNYVGGPATDWDVAA